MLKARVMACALTLLVVTCAGATDYADLQCYDVLVPGSQSPPYWAGLEYEYVTQAGGDTANQLEGTYFDYLGAGPDPPLYDKEVICPWTVDGNYNTSGAVPTVEVTGFSTLEVLCICNVNCSTSRYIEFEVSSRAYATTRVNSAWSSSDDALVTYTSVSSGCESGGGDCCFRREYMKTTTADATSAASNWSPGDQVFIRVKRDANRSSNLSSPWLVTGIRLAWPN